MSLPFSNPVALTSIERLHFFDSSRSFPNRISCRLLVEQRLDLNLSKKACYWLAERHPVLGCGIERIAGRLNWVHNPDLYRSESTNGSTSESTFDSGKSCHWFHVQQLDSEPTSIPDFVELLGASEFYRPIMLIRQWPKLDANDRHQEVNEIWLSIHHSFFDGAGGIQIISDWVQIYENLVAGLEPNIGLPELDHGRFKFRNKLGLGRWKFLRLLPFQTIGLFGATKFVFRKSVQVLDRNSIPDESMQDSARAGVVSAWLTADEMLSIEQLSQSHDFNSNAKLLGDLFSTLQTWNLNRNRGSNPNDWVRVILPINLREIGDRRMSAANRSSLIQIDRRNMEAMAPIDLYRSIQREIGIVLRYQLDRMFLIMIRLVSLNEGVLKRLVRNQKPRGIAVFTNLGRPFRRIEKRLGANGLNPQQLLNLKELDFLAPLRFGTPLNFSLAQFQGKLRLTLHFDPRLIDPVEADGLLKGYLTVIRAGIESSGQ